jgi:hypothetical protein
MPWTRVRLNAFGGPEELELETVADLPEPGAGRGARPRSGDQRGLHRRDDPQGHVSGREGEAALHPRLRHGGIVDAVGPARPRFARATGWRT